MRTAGISRREYLRMMGAGATAVTMSTIPAGCKREHPPQGNISSTGEPASESPEVRADRERQVGRVAHGRRRQGERSG